MQHSLTDTGSAFLTPSWQRLWRAEIDGSKEAALVGRWTSLTLVLQCEGTSLTCVFENGVLQADEPASSTSVREVIVLDGSARAWGEFLKPVPPPLHNDVLALDRRQDDFAIASGRHELIQNLRFVQVILSLARTAMSKEGNDE
ncbi:hypothetical protein [Rhodococcus sp. B10]|uniref:hypothetical protein n=1 Tax=Rhodococcus sp. B10 TaxID=2695876 RepID=UPI001430AFC9|nr:hypothetical protein [Rhodococcus sp. B10]NIL77283.1 hypothetical protein [Rhodococcus sp. B10]